MVRYLPKITAYALLTLWATAEFYQFQDAQSGSEAPKDPLVKYLVQLKDPTRPQFKIKKPEVEVAEVKKKPEVRQPASVKQDQKLFGIKDFEAQLRDEFNFNVTLSNIKDLEENHKYGIRTLLNLSRAPKDVSDEKGCFSLQKWKSSFTASENSKVNTYIKNETIIGLSIFDNPEKWTNKECAPTYKNANEMCEFIHNKFKDTKCGIKLNTVWAARGKATLNKDKIQFLLTKYKSTKGNLYTWINMALKNLSWYKGDIWLTAEIRDSMNMESLKKMGLAMCLKPIKGFLYDGWDQKVSKSLNTVEYKKALEEVSNLCIGIKSQDQMTRIPASVKVRQQNFQYFVGEKANIYIDVQPGTESQLRAEWYHGSNPKPVKTTYLRHKEKKFVTPYSLLIIDNVQADQLGNYTLKVFGEYGESQGTIYLDIKQ